MKNTFILAALAALALPAYANEVVPAGAQVPFQLVQQLDIQQKSGATALFLAHLKLPDGESCILRARAILAWQNLGQFGAMPGASLKCQSWPRSVAVQGGFFVPKGFHGWQPPAKHYCAKWTDEADYPVPSQYCAEYRLTVPPRAIGMWRFYQQVDRPVP